MDFYFTHTKNEIHLVSSTALLCCNGLHCGNDTLSGIVYRKCASESAGCTCVCPLLAFDKILVLNYSSKDLANTKKCMQD
jgi:hypothetical protein